MAEYIEYFENTPTWTKNYVYMGDRLLSTSMPDGSTSYSDFHHPDRLGTRLITNQTNGTAYEQANLPFGAALDAESTITSNPRRFTTYDRSAVTGQDYAQNRSYSAKQGRFTQVDPIGMSAASILNPQSLNMYSYVGNDPINRTDPTGLFWGAIKRFFGAILRIVAFIAMVVAVVVLINTGIGLVAAGGFIKLLGAIAAFAGASFLAAKVGGTAYSRIKEWISKCDVPDFSGLSLSRQDELAQRGVTAEQWNNLRNKQRLGYFNIVAAIAAAGLSLIGWLVDWARGGIQQDRTFFMAGSGATPLLAQVMSSSLFKRSNGHPPNYPDGYRFNSLTRSLQFSFSGDGLRFDADIDFFNPRHGAFGFLGHAYEYAAHKLGRIFGGRNTNPYTVGSRSNWECK
jgi:RHS repeat-associated protein